MEMFVLVRLSGSGLRTQQQVQEQVKSHDSEDIFRLRSLAIQIDLSSIILETWALPIAEFGGQLLISSET